NSTYCLQNSPSQLQLFSKFRGKRKGSVGLPTASLAGTNSSIMVGPRLRHRFSHRYSRFSTDCQSTLDRLLRPMWVQYLDSSNGSEQRTASSSRPKLDFSKWA